MFSFINNVAFLSRSARSSAAASWKTPVKILWKLTEDRDIFVREVLAMNTANVEILNKLAEDEKECVRVQVALNMYTPPEVLCKLSEDHSSWIREKVAENKKTPSQILQKLSQDESWNVRNAVTKNNVRPIDVSGKPIDVFDFLKEHSHDEKSSGKTTMYLATIIARKNPELAKRIADAYNPNSSSERLLKLSEDCNYIVREHVGANKATSVEILRKLARDKNSGVRLSVAENPNTPLDVLNVLSHDEDNLVCLGAKNNKRDKDIMDDDDADDYNSDEKDLEDFIFGRYDCDDCECWDADWCAAHCPAFKYM